MNIYSFLEEIRESLKEITEFKTVKIGLERGVGAKDSPFARVIPVVHIPSGSIESLRFQIAFGVDIKNRDYENLHKEFFDLEEKIIKSLKQLALWKRTVTDEDTVLNLKTAVIEFEAEIC